MNNFIGIIGSEKCIDRSPFDYLKDLGLSFSERQIKGDRFHFWSLDVQPEDAFSQPELVLLLLGDCYASFSEPGLSGRRKLSASDLADNYRERGVDFVKQIKGSFAIIILGQGGSIKVFTDPLSLLSVYYTTYGSELLLSSSLNALASFLNRERQQVRVDNRAVLDHYLFDFILDDHTYLEGIKEVPPGSILEFSGSGVLVKQYFDPFSYFDLSGPTLTREEGIEQLKAVLKGNIDLYSEGPEKTAVALTGGFDSRSILALLGTDAAGYAFYSYGREGSWDIRIPKLIAERLNLDYTPFYLDEDYAQAFPSSANLAVMLSEGIAEFTHANIAYVYGNFLRRQSSVLAGLFGSELIKTPSSRGLFLDQNMIGLLNANDPVSALRKLLSSVKAQGAAWLSHDKHLEEEMVEMIGVHPFINNRLPINEKYFHYLLMVGMRKYFRKEIRIQSPWKSNLHPYFDLDFIKALLKTPYPWVYNFSQNKSLVKNLTIHRLYAEIIHQNPMLSDIISTHGYRPRYLLSKPLFPLLAFEYFRNKRRIRSESGLNFQSELALDFINQQSAFIFHDSEWGPAAFANDFVGDIKDYLKMASLRYWLLKVGASFH